MDDELVVLDPALGVIHRLQGVAAQHMLVASSEDRLVSRRATLTATLASFPLLVITSVLPSSATAASTSNEDPQEPSPSSITASVGFVEDDRVQVTWTES
jgi:hypothetical protein